MNIIARTALAPRVLVVAVLDSDKVHWRAYIADVPGKDHRAEAADVAARGTKLSPEIAGMIFKYLPIENYAP